MPAPPGAPLVWPGRFVKKPLNWPPPAACATPPIVGALKVPVNCWAGRLADAPIAPAPCADHMLHFMALHDGTVCRE